MAGNVSEWTASSYLDRNYVIYPSDHLDDNPTMWLGRFEKEIRKGSYYEVGVMCVFTLGAGELPMVGILGWDFDAHILPTIRDTWNVLFLYR